MQDIEKLIKFMSKLPGLGPRSARRAVLDLLTNKDEKLTPFVNLLNTTAQTVVECSSCGNLDTTTICNICSNEKRDDKTLCVVENVADLWALERGNIYNGKYHVLGGALSAIDGITPDKLRLNSLKEKVFAGNIEELIIATNSTTEGQTTAFYITELLAEKTDLKISQLAQGIPFGGELDYLDEGTLGSAIKKRLTV